jgi:hypothetical protein
MTFAELVIKFEVQGDSSTKTTIRAVEAELKNVSNASVNAANRFSSSMTKISQSSRGLQNFQNIGSSLTQQFTQVASSTNPLSSNLLNMAQSFALLGNSVKGISFPKLSSSAANLRVQFLNLTRFGKDTLLFFVDLHRQMFESALGMAHLTRGVGIVSMAFQKFAQGALILQKIPLGIMNGIMSLQKAFMYFAPVINEVLKEIQKFGAVLLEFGKFFLPIISGAGAAVAAMTAFSAAVIAIDVSVAKETLKASFAFETLQQRLSALTTPESAKNILEFVRRLAEPSNFTSEQLANSAVQLEAFGLESRRILPIIAQLGMAFGADTEKLKVLTDMFGRLSQGQMPDVQVMAGFGISKSKLMKEGIKFDAQGSLLSSTREVFIALEKLVQRDYGKIFETMQKTGDAKLASVIDVFERLKIRIGDALAPMAKTVLDALSNVLSALEKTKVLEELARVMTLPFRSLEKAVTGSMSTNITGAMTTFVSSLIAGFEEINIQTALFIEQMGRVGRIVNLVFSGKGEERDKFGMFGPSKQLQKEMDDFAKNFAGFFALGRPDKVLGTGFAGEGSRFSKRQAEISDKMKGQLGKGGKSFEDLLKESKLFDYGKLENAIKNDKTKEKTQRTLDLIQQNTKTQNELTLRNMTYGGGELAAQGISAVQMGGFRSVSSPQINASNDIVRGVEKIVRGYSNSNNLNFSFRRS